MEGCYAKPCQTARDLVVRVWCRAMPGGLLGGVPGDASKVPESALLLDEAVALLAPACGCETGECEDEEDVDSWGGSALLWVL